MKQLAFTLLILSGCAATAPLPSYAPISAPPGYPIFISSMNNHCLFQVQDMLVDASQLSEWMRDLPQKSRSIDLVERGQPGDCARQAYALVMRVGFTDVRLRHENDLSYPSGLPPA
jgi:hypothetical protein